MTKAIIDKYGMTDGCPACMTMVLGGSGITYNEEYRKRVEKEMRDRPEQKMKLKAVKKRRDEFVRRHLGGDSKNAKTENDDGGLMDTDNSGNTDAPGEGQQVPSVTRPIIIVIFTTYVRTHIIESEGRGDENEMITETRMTTC